MPLPRLPSFAVAPRLSHACRHRIAPSSLCSIHPLRSSNSRDCHAPSDISERRRLRLIRVRERTGILFQFPPAVAEFSPRGRRILPPAGREVWLAPPFDHGGWISLPFRCALSGDPRTSSFSSRVTCRARRDISPPFAVGRSTFDILEHRGRRVVTWVPPHRPNIQVKLS